MPYNPRQKAALFQALQSLLGGVLAGGPGPLPGRRGRFIPGLYSGRPVDKGFIGIPTPVLPPGLSGRVPPVPKEIIGIPQPVLPPGLVRGRVPFTTPVDKGFIPPPGIPRPGLSGRGDIETKNPPGNIMPLPRVPDNGDYRPFRR